MMADLKKTPLNGIHRALGAKMIDFGGWDMPVQYSGLSLEHNCVREKAGLFDVSHMGECRITGPQSEKAVNWLITNDVTAMVDGQILYSPMCYHEGGTVDDLIVYRYNTENYLLVINASNIDKDMDWITQNTATFNVSVENESDKWGQLALQGPLAQDILTPLLEEDPCNIPFFHFETMSLGGVEVIISRSGYTGEDGFEIYGPASAMGDIWTLLMDKGKGFGLLPCGLGARDTLRFEAALPLYGNELGPDISPLEAGLSFFVKLEGDDFIGKSALLKQKTGGLKRRIAGFEMTGKGIPRHGYPIFDRSEREIGVVTTGYMSPSLGKAMGLALIEMEFSSMGEEIFIGIRKNKVPARVCSKRFYSKKYKK
jgi:aminomethyltransferase